MDCHFLLQRIFLIQGLKPALLHCRQILGRGNSPSTVGLGPTKEEAKSLQVKMLGLSPILRLNCQLSVCNGFEPPWECQYRACSFLCPYLHSLNTSADLSKAVVLLDPEWDQVLKNDRVTLKCQGTYPVEDNSTKWWHNGTLTSKQTSSYLIADAQVEDSGEYNCQTGLSAPSDLVKLEVHEGE